MLFSQRKGLKPLKSIAQKEGMDEALRYGLWDALHLCLWDQNTSNNFEYSNLKTLFFRYWHLYFHKPIDNLPERFDSASTIIREYFVKCEWNEAYDFIEFTAQNMPEELVGAFTRFSNQVLSRELSAYRLVDNQLAEITSEEEISSIESAIANTDKLKGINTHLKTALNLLADRKNPDYRNSIKEAISSVEALAQLMTSDPKATLGSALKLLESRNLIHPALKSSLSSLYGYTSDADGIRHAMLDESNLSFNDAKFMLVSCTAFTNYMIAKASENGLKLG